MQKPILVLVSNPNGTSRVNFSAELRKVQEAIQRSEKQQEFKVELRFEPNATELRRHILKVKPCIVHFCGHGTEQGLILDDNQGQAVVGSNQFIVDLLKEFDDLIECVVLNACETAGLAEALAQHLNYVIGMNQPVYDEAAIAFAEAFYDTLGADFDYKRAFKVGKTAVLGLTEPHTDLRKAVVVDQDGNPQSQNSAHQIPVLHINSRPKTIQAAWLTPEERQQAIRELLAAMEREVNTIKLFHTNHPLVLQDQYIPVQVTLERRYQHTVETIGSYAESEAELKRIYALKGSGEEEIRRQQVDWEEAKRQQSQMMVLADPGMGKSTLLHREAVTTIQQAYQALQADWPLQDITLPLLMRLSTLADETVADKTINVPVEEAILKIVQERHPGLLKHHPNAEVNVFLNQFLQQQLRNGKALLLLDALDEVPDQQWSKLLKKLETFAGAYSSCKIIGTSRIVGYGGNWVSGAKDLEIVPFTRQQTETYIEKWFANAQPVLQNQSVSACDLTRALRERPQLAGLAQNPLLLSLICSLFQQQQLTLPARRSQVYEQAVNCMLREWNRTRPDYNDNRIAAKTRLLEALAYFLSEQGQEVIDYDDLYDWVEQYLDSAAAPRDLRTDKTADLIAELSETDGILQKLYRDRQDQQYLFLHRTFQEYFTACFLRRSIKQNKQNPAYLTELVRKYNWKYRWHETLTLLAGLMEDPMQLVEAIAAEKDDIFQTQLLLAGRCLAECGERPDPLAEQIIERIYQFWRTYPWAKFIQSVVVEVGQTWNSLVQTLQMALKHSSVPHFAAWTLGEIGHKKAIDILVQTLSNQTGEIRRNAAEALAVWASEEMRSEKVIDALFEALSDKDVFVKRGIAQALGKIGGEKAINALLQTLSDEDLYTRCSAAKALGEIGTEKAIDALLQTLSNDDLAVRHSSTQAIGKIGGKKAIDAALQNLSNKDWVVRYRAVEVLEALGSKEAIGGLLQTLSDDVLEVKQRAIEALGELGSEEAIDVLLQTLSTGSSSVRSRAAKALGQIGHEKAIDALLQTLSDDDWDVIRSAVWALGQMRSEKAADALLQVLSLTDVHRNSFINRAAVRALGEIKSEESIDILLQAISDDDLYTRRSAIEALGKIGSKKSTDAMIQVLLDEDWDARSRAAKALGQIGSKRAVNALILALSDESLNVQHNAAEALEKISNIASLEKLLQLPDLDLSDPVIFSLARSWAIRFSESGSPFIPVYPELLLSSTSH